jgi:hypothetical protein
LDPSNATCSVQTDVCDYLVASEGFDELCAPISSFPAVTWDGDALQSVETGLFELAFTFNGTVYSITVHDAVIDVPVQLSGSTMTSSAGGRVGGALVKQDLLDLVGLIDTGSVNVPLLLNALVEPDIDADQDGVFESISVLLELTGIGGNIVGVYP